MPNLVALDVAVIPPADVRERAIAMSAALGSTEPDGPTLDAEHIPHVTLTQQFVRSAELDAVFEHVESAVRGQPPLRLRVTGAVRHGTTIVLAVDPVAPLVQLHERLMESLHGLERAEGGAGAFFDPNARVGDVLWVAGYRLKSSFGSFQPHITLGQAVDAPVTEPFEFEADTVAACHLGRFCTCRRVLRQWTLGGRA